MCASSMDGNGHHAYQTPDNALIPIAIASDGMKQRATAIRGKIMARKRQIDPAIWTSEQFIKLSFPARLLFIGMISNADDLGRLKGNITYLKMVVFPLDNISIDDLSTLRNEIINNKLGIYYSNNNSEYIELPTFIKHQYMTKRFPSRIPSPTDVNSLLLTTTQPVNNSLTGNQQVNNELYTKKPHEEIDSGLITGNQQVNNGLHGIVSNGIVSNGIVELSTATAEIFKLFEENYQKITQGVRDALCDFIDTYSAEKVLKAINEGIKYNHRNLAYVEAILKDNGNGSKSKQNRQPINTPYKDINKYLDEKGW